MTVFADLRVPMLVTLLRRVLRWATEGLEERPMDRASTILKKVWISPGVATVFDLDGCSKWICMQDNAVDV